MKQKIFSKTVSCLISASLSIVSVFPDHAPAADEGKLRGEIDLGFKVLDLDGRSYKYGEYSGAEEDDAYFIGGADLSYSRGNRYYLDFKADRLGYDNRSIRLDTGIYGNYKLSLGFSETPHLLSNSSMTPFYGAGSTRVTLPAGFATSATTSGMTNLSSNLEDIRLEINRKVSTVGLSATFGNGLDFNVGVSHEDKEGIKALGGPLGINGGFASSVILPEPVDYSTNDLSASLSYNGNRVNVEFKYNLSVFDNHHQSLTWDAPFIRYSLLSPNYPSSARTSLPPDNQYQNFSLSGGVSFGNSARISAVAEYGIMEQDTSLLPYTINTASTVATPLPRASAEAEIDVKHLEINFWTRPVKGLDLNARYRYYETDNRTPSDLFLRVINDTGDQVSVTNSAAAYNLPYDQKQNKITLDAAYRLSTTTSLKVGYALDNIERSYREVDETKEQTFSAKLNSRPVSYATLDLSYSRGERTGSSYQSSDVFNARHSQNYIDTLATNVRFDNHPDTRKYDIADRDRTKYGAHVSLFSAANTVVGFYYDHRDDKYRESLFGLKDSESDAFTVDITFNPLEFATVNLFYTRELYSSSLNSRSYASGGVKAAQSADPSLDWLMEQEDRNDSIGVGVDFLLLSRKLKLGVDYTLERSATAISLAGGSTVGTLAGIPDLETLRHRVDATASYSLSKNKSITLGYQYENYSSDDWSTDGMNYTTIDHVLPLSLTVADYESHAIFATFTYYFDSGR